MTAKKDVISSMRFYIDRIVADPTIGGMKVLLLDQVTTKVVSMVYSLSQILDKEVYLVEQLGKRHEAMQHLKAAVFIEPSEENFDLLANELKDPKFKEYHLFFSNTVPAELLSRLGRLDELEVILQVQEYYADVLAINDEFYHLGLDRSLVLSSASARAADSSVIFDKTVGGILSVLLAMKRRPQIIRHQAASEIARRVAGEVSARIEKEDSLFDFRRQDSSLLLVLDRRDDPITPLLTQWTYQAMVHELLGLNNNRVLLKGAPNISKDLEEVVLSVTQDEFFAQHLHANFGDLGTAVKQLLDEYQRVSKMNENITSIEDMQAFLERYPAFRSRSINVSKHVAVMSELARLTDACQLLDISELEQEIACSNDHSNHKAELLMKIRNPKVKAADKLRLTLLFMLRYESYNEARELKAALSAEKGVSAAQLTVLDALLEYAGEARRAPGLFGAGGLISKIGKSIASSLNGVQNVYTQHQPLLSYILESLSKGKLKESAFPAVVGNVAGGGRPVEVFVFIVGGATFEEATKVAEFNANNPGMRVVLGGSCVHNSSSFLKELSNTFSM